MSIKTLKQLLVIKDDLMSNGLQKWLLGFRLVFLG